MHYIQFRHMHWTRIRNGAGEDVRHIIASPPTDWSTQRKGDYFDWAAQVVARCRGINAQLEEAFDRAYAGGIAIFTTNAA
jgi:guanosine-3',5'-bis(diphosphate) 3'-pyrophosphohydrolase